MKLRLYLFLSSLVIIFVAPSVIQAQTISGTIYGGIENEPLIGASIHDQISGRGTVTGFDGTFTLELDQLPTQVKVSYLGYHTKTITVSEAGKIDITLDENTSRLDEVVVVGTRGKERTVLTSPVPIDNINAGALKSSGQSSIDQMINFRVPSYNSTNQAISDATAHFDPSELRNLGPSRTLVLVNGKRKNQSSLVYVNDTPGKGEVGTDMKSIPAEAIERVEVLRDGAAAQYGSDAIAGVINVILKERTDGEVTVGYGTTTEGDGTTYNVGVNKGFEFENGFLNLTATFYHQDETNRAGEPGRDDLFGVDGTNAWIQSNPDLGMTIGQPEYDKLSFVANFDNSYNDDKGEIYAFASYTNRDGTSFALYRTPYWITDDAGLLTPAGQPYGGFQPTFETTVNDFVGTIGNRYKFGEWNTDISFSVGSNNVDYTIGQTINVGLLPDSPTEFDPGGYTFGHILGNIDVSRVIGDWTLSFGTEARREKFEVRAGQKESYEKGGAQSFPGLQPDNALDENRTNIGIYAGLDYDISEELLLGGAIRYENYSDFGSNVSWKINGRYLIGTNNNGAIRASVSTGFRAPSLHQVYLSNVQTLISGNTVSNQGTFNNVSPVIQGLGVPALDAETSFNITAGITYKLTDHLSLSADYYNIKVDDRVLFTGEIGFDGDDDNTNPVEEILIANKVTSIKFFVNALNTTTTGFDIVLDYQDIELGAKSNLDLLLSANFNETDIDGTINAPGVIGAEGYDIFNRKEQSRVITARPNEKILLGANFQFGKFSAALNNTFFGEVTWRHATDPAKDQTFSSKIITDLILNYDINDRISINATVNNLFDVYPDELDPKGDVVTDLGGRFRYPWEVNQFGFLGTVIKAGVSARF